MTLNPIESRRLKVLDEENQRRCKLIKRRLLASYCMEGVLALAHGNEGNWHHKVIGASFRERVVELAKTKCRSFNQRHFSEKVDEKEEISLYC
jgi:hypothetical protein